MDQRVTFELWNEGEDGTSGRRGGGERWEK